MAEEAVPVPASTVLMIRDADDAIEVFMIQRTRAVDFVPGALVFPGGKVDEADADPALDPYIRGETDGDWHAYQVGAIREVFEESGVLLAYHKGSDDLLTESELEPFLDQREPLESGDQTMLGLAEAANVDYACDQLVRFAHWITPAMMPRRYDTQFWLMPAPPDQWPVHTGGEAVESVWITPDQAIEDAIAEKRQVILPTREVLKQLGRSKTVADAIALAREEEIVTVLPVPEEKDGERLLRIPDADGDGTVLKSMDIKP